MCNVSAIKVCAIKHTFVQSNKHLCNQTNICAIKHTFVQSNTHLCNQTSICAIKHTFVQSNTQLCNQTSICAIRQTFVQLNKHFCNPTSIYLGAMFFLLKNIPKFGFNIKYILSFRGLFGTSERSPSQLVMTAVR